MTHMTTTLASSGANYTPIGILLAILVPICAAVAVIVWNYYRLQRHRANAVAVATYRKLAEEAVANMAQLRTGMAKLAGHRQRRRAADAARRGMSAAIDALSLRRDRVRLVLSRGLWAGAWYLLAYQSSARCCSRSR